MFCEQSQLCAKQRLPLLKARRQDMRYRFFLLVLTMSIVLLPNIAEYVAKAFA